jgi:D-alanyl-D-alanine dipeptidase
MMSHKIFKFLFICFASTLAIQDEAQLPENFVYVKDVIPDLDVELRYFSANNFVGDTIDAYKSNKLILTKPAAEALKKVQSDLKDQNLCLLVYDAYRPQQAVNHFMRWAKDLNDTINKPEFYPEIKKRNLFNKGYIASRSGHSRGSTVDLTLMDRNTDEVLDMGSPFDFFGKASWTAHPNLTAQQKNNRNLLLTAMQKHNFRNYPKEWWHFSLRWEPFPNTYFDFPIE